MMFNLFFNLKLDTVVYVKNWEFFCLKTWVRLPLYAIFEALLGKQILKTTQWKYFELLKMLLRIWTRKICITMTALYSARHNYNILSISVYLHRNKTKLKLASRSCLVVFGRYPNIIIKKIVVIRFFR